MAKLRRKNKPKEHNRGVIQLGNGSVQIDDDSISLDYGNQDDYEQIDERDVELVQDKKSDDSYQETASRIVDISENQLKEHNDTKKDLQKILLIFFIFLLSIQIIAIIGLVLLKGFCGSFKINDNVLITFITSAFVETLGVIAIMVKFSFNIEQETKIISILSSYIKDFKVYNSSEHGSNK